PFCNRFPAHFVFINPPDLLGEIRRSDVDALELSLSNMTSAGVPALEPSRLTHDVDPDCEREYPATRTPRNTNMPITRNKRLYICLFPLRLTSNSTEGVAGDVSRKGEFFGGKRDKKN